jgi:hypothetical protein
MEELVNLTSYRKSEIMNSMVITMIKEKPRTRPTRGFGIRQAKPLSFRGTRRTGCLKIRRESKHIKSGRKQHTCPCRKLAMLKTPRNPPWPKIIGQKGANSLKDGKKTKNLTKMFHKEKRMRL